MIHRSHPAPRPANAALRPAPPARLVQGLLSLAGALALLMPPGARADEAAASLRQADRTLGQRLIEEHRCDECHARRVGGDGSAIYRPKGRIARPAALLSMVEMCNTELKLQLFPEDVAAIASALNEAHYRFKLTPP